MHSVLSVCISEADATQLWEADTSKVVIVDVKDSPQVPLLEGKDFVSIESERTEKHRGVQLSHLHLFGGIAQFAEQGVPTPSTRVQFPIPPPVLWDLADEDWR